MEPSNGCLSRMSNDGKESPLPMGALPLLLCGPMLRRVEPRSVSVWVALSQSRTVRVDVWADLVDVGVGPALASPPRDPIASAFGPTRRIGDNLHICLLSVPLGHVAGTPPLAPGTLCSYNVTLTGGGADADLRSLGLLQDSGITDGGSDGTAPIAPEPLGYENGRLPNFATAPAKLEDLHLVHCSCSRMGGEGEPLLPHVDDLVKDNRNDPLKRPHQLFLTGDQIYADVVPTALLAVLIPLGASLLGSTVEQITVPVEGAERRVDVTAKNFPPGRRKTLVDAVAGMTSDDAQGHLLSFGEYAATYLLAWSPAAWPRTADGKTLILGCLPKPSTAPTGAMAAQWAKNDRWRSAAGDQVANLTVLDPAVKGEIDALMTPLFTTFSADDTSPLHAATSEALDAAISSVFVDREKIEKMYENVWKVRRAFASIPTYAICDDHEVTDDWFLTQAWRNRVLGNSLGRAIIHNAISAYVLFQGWGNDPDAFNKPLSPHSQFLDAAITFFPSGAPPWPAVAPMKALDDLFGFDNAPQRLNLDYFVDGSAHRVIVMDSRTRRSYQGLDTPPSLLSDQAIADQITRGPFPHPLPAGIEILIVVSPAPMLGPPLFEETLWPLAIRGYDAVWLSIQSKQKQSVEKTLTGIDRSKPTGGEYFDAEGWAANPVALEKMLAALAAYGAPVVILAGDVHYASSFTLDYQANGKPAVRFLHFTSSAACNAWFPRVCSFLSSISWARGLLALELPAKRFGWNASSPSPIDSVNNESPTMIGRVLRHPVLLPANGWRHHHVFQRPPDWRWELNQLSDTRDDADRPPEALPFPYSGTDLSTVGGPPTDALSPTPGSLGYGALARSHASSLDRMFLGRGTLFANNFGHVFFTRDANGLSVSHELHSIRPNPDPNEDDEPYTIHKSSTVSAISALPNGIG